MRTAVLLGSVAALAGACDDAEEEEDEPDIEAVRLTVTQQPGGTPVSYVVRTNGVTPSPIILRIGQNVVQAVGLDASNQAIDLEDDFELRFVGSVQQGGTTTALPAGVEFTRSGLTGTIIASTPALGQRTVALQLFHRGENHSDFDVNNVPISVVQITP